MIKKKSKPLLDKKDIILIDNNDFPFAIVMNNSEHNNHNNFNNFNNFNEFNESNRSNDSNDSNDSNEEFYGHYFFNHDEDLMDECISVHTDEEVKSDSEDKIDYESIADAICNRYKNNFLNMNLADIHHFIIIENYIMPYIKALRDPYFLDSISNPINDEIWISVHEEEIYKRLMLLKNIFNNDELNVLLGETILCTPEQYLNFNIIEKIFLFNKIIDSLNVSMDRLNKRIFMMV